MMPLVVNWGNALSVMVIGLLIVFSVLCLLILVLTLMGKLMKSSDQSEAPETPIQEHKETPQTQDEELAAVAMAIYLHYAAVHDEESHVLTIKRVHSEWNAKIYEVNNMLR